MTLDEQIDDAIATLERWSTKSLAAAKREKRERLRFVPEWVHREMAAETMAMENLLRAVRTERERI